MDIHNLLNYLEENNYMVVSNDEDITNRIIEELCPQQDENVANDNDDSVEPPKISTRQAQEYLESYHKFSESLKE
jgi:effector-binding domain-containing protein